VESDCLSPNAKLESDHLLQSLMGLQPKYPYSSG
jgi:hypothetical protein